MFSEDSDTTLHGTIENEYLDGASLDIHGGDNSSAITLKDLARLSLKAAIYIKETKPDAILACDRGARLFALAINYHFNKLDVSKRLPTKDNKIHFVRIGREYNENLASTSVGHALRLSELDNYGEARVLFIDDWIRTGRTVELFCRAAEYHGLASKNISIATICGARLDSINHIVCDETRDPRNSIWNAYEDYNPVCYPSEDAMFPIVTRGIESRLVRRRIEELIDEQYQTKDIIAA